MKGWEKIQDMLLEHTIPNWAHSLTDNYMEKEYAYVLKVNATDPISGESYEQYLWEYSDRPLSKGDIEAWSMREDTPIRADMELDSVEVVEAYRGTW